MASNRTQTSTFLEEASLKTIYVALGNSLCPRSTFLTIHLTTEVFTRKNTSSVWAKVNSLYWTEWKLQMIMKGLGLVQLAPCLFFFFFYKSYSWPFFAFCPTWSRDMKGKSTGTIYTQVAEARSTINQEHGTAMFAKATTAQNPLYSAQILACRCLKSSVKYVTAFLKELLVSKWSFFWSGTSEGRITCSSFNSDRR